MSRSVVLSALATLIAVSGASGDVIIRLKDGRSITVTVNKEDVEAIVFTEVRGSNAPSTSTGGPSGTPLPYTTTPSGADFTVRIISGRFGAAGKYCDAAPRLRAVCDGKTGCDARSDSSWCGDPNSGVAKELEVQYSCGGTPTTLRAREDETLRVRCR